MCVVCCPQVLISIQTQIMNAEPWYNEPGNEAARGSPHGAASSAEFDDEVRLRTRAPRDGLGPDSK